MFSSCREEAEVGKKTWPSRADLGVDCGGRGSSLGVECVRGVVDSGVVGGIEGGAVKELLAASCCLISIDLFLKIKSNNRTHRV